MKYKTRIDKRGQVIIPEEVRERYRIQLNSEVIFVDECGQLTIQAVPAVSSGIPDPWEAMRGVLKEKIQGVDTDIEDMRGR